MYKLLIIFLLSIAGVSFAQAGELPIKNAGFVPANIWYSKDPFFAGETVRVYTIIFNGSTYDLAGGVEFLDNGAVIGKTKFSLSAGGRVQDVWVDWKASQGSHTITARLVNVVGDGPNGKQAVSLGNIETGKSTRVVDLDPTVIESQSKAQEQKIADAKNKALGKAGDAISTATEYIPAPIKENVSIGANVLEKFRVGEGYQFQIAKENKANDIAVLKASTTTSASILQKSGNVFASVSNATEKPFAYVMLALLTVLQYFFQWQIIFYGVILYALYRAIKWVAKKIQNR